MVHGMNEIVVLDVNHYNKTNQSHQTHFVLVGEYDSPILVEAGSSPLGVLQKKGFLDNEIADVILTHFHPDQVNAIPNIFMHWWLNGRQEAMRFYGLAHCIDRLQDLLDYYGWVDWPEFFPVCFWKVYHKNDAHLLENRDFVIRAYPLEHSIPNIGLRIFNKNTGKILAYISDTNPCNNVINLASNADIVIYEIYTDKEGYSSANQAGELAQLSNARSLYLNPWKAQTYNRDVILSEARQSFTYSVQILDELDAIPF